jgi:predicted ATP-dependent endonuclease of OLD family
MDITKSTLLFSKGVILVEGICEAMLLPAFAPIVLSEYNNNRNLNKLPETLEEAGVTVVNINGINFKYFYPLFCDIDKGNDRLPIRCSGITDRDPAPEIKPDESGKEKKTEIYPIIGENVVGANEAIEMEEYINKTKMARLYIASLKTFEYDLAISGNFSIMAKIIEENWPYDGGETGVKKRCERIQKNHISNYYDDKEKAREDAKFIYKHIDCDEIGKGIFSQALLKELEEGNKEFVIPNYIKKAIIWACGGECD